MGRGKELAKNTVVLSIGKLSAQIISFLLLPLYTSVLNEAEYGTVDLILSYIQLLYPIVTCQLDQALFRFLVTTRDDRNEQTVIVSTVLYATCIQCVVFSLLYLAIQSFMSFEYKLFFLINVLTSAFSSFAMGVCRGIGNNGIYAVGGFLQTSATIVLNVVLLAWVGMRVEGMLLSSCLAALVSGSYALVHGKVYKYIGYRSIRKDKLKKFYQYSLPLIPNQLSWWVLKASEKTVINIAISVAANGLIAVASKFSSAYILVYNIFNLAWTESVVLHLKDKDGKQYITSVINILFGMLSSACFLAISCMPVVFNLFVNEAFNEAYGLVPIYMISALFNAVVGLYSTLYIANQDTKAVAITSGISAAINLVINIILVGFIGIYAAPVSAVVGFGSMMIYRYFHSRRYVDIRIIKKNIGLTIVAGTSVLILYYISSQTAAIASFAISIVYAIIVNKPVLQQVIRKFTRC